MSADTVLQTGVAPTGEGLQVSLHPLPLLNISEHYIRVKIQNEGSQTASTSKGDRVKVIGALIGAQNGREVEIVNSFELALSPDGQEVNHEFFAARQAQFKQVFPSFEFLGWYTVGTSPTPLDLNIHAQLLAYNESPIFLQLSPPSAAGGTTYGSSSLPIEIYESVVDIVAGKSILKFVKIAGEEGGYKIETGEAERIAVEGASKTALAPSSSNRVAKRHLSVLSGLNTQRNAIGMLQARIHTILQYLTAVQDGSAPPNHEVLRQISALAAVIGSSDSSEAQQSAVDGSFVDEFEREENDVLLTSILDQMTRSLEASSMLIDKFSILQHRDPEEGGLGGTRKQSSRQRPGGLGRRGEGHLPSLFGR